MSNTHHNQAAAQQENLVGRTLCDGEYQVQAVLGQGGMGQVLLASHTSLDASFALKQGRADQPVPQSVVEELDRLLQRSTVTHHTSSHPPANDFPVSGGIQIDRFIHEALLLARL